MSRFDADLRLQKLDSQDWELFSDLSGAGLVAHNLTQATQAALDRMLTWVDEGDGVLTAAKKAFNHVEAIMNNHEDVGARESGPRGVLITIIEEYARRRFEADLDLYWDLTD
jgi:hypothetical protein